MTKTLTQKILDTGWQSWSVGSNKSIFSLWRDFNPLNEEYELPNSLKTKLRLKKPVTGWCSWYIFGRDVNEEKILNQVNWFKKNKDFSIEYILVDDGWCLWGDWFKSRTSSFPKGIKALSDKIKKKGYKSGIWMAPFMVEEDSETYKNHKDWLIGKNGKPKNNLNWTIFDNLYLKRYVFDIRLPEVKKFIFNNIDILLDKYKFDLIKLDFLYSVYFIPNMTAKEAGGFIREVFEYIRRTYPHVYTIACGSPLMPVIGVADSVRVGPDNVSPLLDGLPILSSVYHYFRIRSVLDNIKSREFTSIYWNIDPDAYVCRASLGISDNNLAKLQKIFIECRGNIFLGDDMTKLPKDRINKYILPLFKS